jgi:hypothetical protein
MSDWYVLTAILHATSLTLCSLLIYSQYRLRDILLLVLAILGFLLHTMMLIGFIIWGTHIGPMPGWACVLRKGIYVYIAQCIYLMTAIVIVRLWMIAYRHRLVMQPHRHQLERRACLFGLLIPCIPAAFATLPQWIGAMYHSDLRRLDKCSAGYIQSWQVFMSGSAFMILPTCISLIGLIAICLRVYFLFRYRHVLLPEEHSQKAFHLTISTLLRVLLLCVTAGMTGVYYIVADFIAVFHLPNSEMHHNDLGHFLSSIWGISLFFVFGTSHLSLAALRGDKIHHDEEALPHSSRHQRSIFQHPTSTLLYPLTHRTQSTSLMETNTSGTTIYAGEMLTVCPPRQAHITQHRTYTHITFLSPHLSSMH